MLLLTGTRTQSANLSLFLLYQASFFHVHKQMHFCFIDSALHVFSSSFCKEIVAAFMFFHKLPFSTIPITVILFFALFCLVLNLKIYLSLTSGILNNFWTFIPKFCCLFYEDSVNPRVRTIQCKWYLCCPSCFSYAALLYFALVFFKLTL